MRRSLSPVWVLLAITPSAAQSVWASGFLTAEEFAARCADEGGQLTLTEDLRVAGGTAQLAACQVELGDFRLAIQHAQFFSTGDLAINGPLDGQLRIEQSQFFQRAQGGERINVTLIAHRLQVEDTEVDVLGNIILRSGEPSFGDVLVEAVRFRSRSPSGVIHLGSGPRWTGQAEGVSAGCGWNNFHSSEL